VREVRIPGIRRVLRVSWTHRAVAREVDDEIRFHIESRAAELVRLGASERDARERAQAEFGDLDRSRRELAAVDRRRLGIEHRQELLMSFLEDLRYAGRTLIRRPALVVVVALTLSIGIAANALMFGVIDQLLLRPPPHVGDPEGVKRIYYRDVAAGKPNFGPVTTYPVVTALRQHAPAFSDVAAFSFKNDYSLGRGPDARSVAIQMVSANFFRALRVRLALGPGFGDEHDRIPQSDRVAVVSHGFWEQELGGDWRVVGRSLPLQGSSFTIVGVAPPGFAGIDHEKIDVWIPIASHANEALGTGWHNTSNNWWAQLIGRVRDDATPELAAEQATAAYRGLVKEWNNSFRDSTSSVVLSSIIGTRTPTGMSGEGKVSLWLMGVSAIVLLIACANVANLLLARTTERRREISVRLALGVGRGRLLRMLLTEAALLAMIGAAAALLIALAASRVVQQVLLPGIAWSESIIDARVFGFTLAVTVACVLLAGIAPAVHGVGTRVSEGLKASARQHSGRRGVLRFTLVLTQAALSVLLLVGAGLFVKSLRNVVTRDVGIDRDRVLRATMPLRAFGFDTAQVEELFNRGVERVRAMPGVAGVAVVRLSVPMGSASARGFAVPGVKRPDLPLGGPYNSVVQASFFRTVGAPIIRGREFSEAEERTPSRVVIVNDYLARNYWPNADPLGQCVHAGSDKTCSQVIGVSKTVMQFSLVDDDRAMVYAPPRHPGFAGSPPGAMLVRLSGAAESDRFAAVVQRELQSLAPTMPFVSVKPYSELVSAQLRPRRLGATMFSLFGIIALVIAAVGLYSSLAYWVSQRTQEIGVRMALGARGADVVRLVLWQSSRPVLLGLLLGGATALVATRWVSGLLYETSPRDPAVYLGAGLVLALAATVASIIPARRSAAVDPALAMRAD
jgi:putative ABC transport system permease protein